MCTRERSFLEVLYACVAFYVLLNCLVFGNVCFGFETGSNFSLRCSGTYCIAQAGLKLIAIPLPLEYLEYRCEPSYRALSFMF